MVTIGGSDGLLQEKIDLIPKLLLKHHQNVITLEFALLNFIKSNKNRYAYQLEGFDQNWNEVNSGSATYTNLPRGNMFFMLKELIMMGYGAKRFPCSSKYFLRFGLPGGLIPFTCCCFAPSYLW
ncbi:triple tyrosine motif-containing protein [Paraflavitalea speifideaquila]|uniref:triple tyrosine motif-containing protein n=1 Tax=Paraflavitalea speifideaquila TaxID=3076558 RepID=UPI0028E809B9|nr:triple tyrosine motif-containing protein [Paraflavitalea speifideiaquila]